MPEIATGTVRDAAGRFAPRYFSFKNIETDAKKGNRPRNRPLIKIHNFDTIIVKLCQNDLLMCR